MQVLQVHAQCVKMQVHVVRVRQVRELGEMRQQMQQEILQGAQQHVWRVFVRECALRWWQPASPVHGLCTCYVSQ